MSLYRAGYRTALTRGYRHPSSAVQVSKLVAIPVLVGLRCEGIQCLPVFLLRRPRNTYRHDHRGTALAST